MARVGVSGAELFYQVVGDGPPIVFAHGGGGTHLHWWQQLAFFGRHYRCVVYDQRGHGMSGGVPGSADLALHHHDLLALLDHLDIERAVLVGQSMGGLAISGMAQQHPERTAAIVMVDTPFGFATPALARWAAVMIDKINGGFKVLAHTNSPRFALEQPLMASLFATMAGVNEPRQDPRGLAVFESFRDGPSGDYSTFSVPTLFVVGADDTLTPPWLISATADAVADSELVVIPNSGHSPHFEQAGAFNDAVFDFVARQPGW